MGSDASATGTAHPAGAHAPERSTFRSTAVSRSSQSSKDLLSGFERPSVSCSLFERTKDLVERSTGSSTRAVRGPRAYSSAG